VSQSVTESDCYSSSEIVRNSSVELAQYVASNERTLPFVSPATPWSHVAVSRGAVSENLDDLVGSRFVPDCIVLYTLQYFHFSVRNYGTGYPYTGSWYLVLCTVHCALCTVHCALCSTVQKMKKYNQDYSKCFGRRRRQVRGTIRQKCQRAHCSRGQFVDCAPTIQTNLGTYRTV
jgi:hypothetical protein